MVEELKYLTEYYSNHNNEDERLASRHGSVEFRTTMRYIERYLKPGDRIIEIGAGTGRYALHMSDVIDKMDDAEFELFLQYHYATCEREDMIGLTHHSIDIFRKD